MIADRPEDFFALISVDGSDICKCVIGRYVKLAERMVLQAMLGKIKCAVNFSEKIRGTSADKIILIEIGIFT